MSQSQSAPHTSPQGGLRRHLSLIDATSIIVGIIIGASIFRSSPLIASQVPNVG